MGSLGLFELYSNLPSWLRLCVAALVLAVGLAMTWAGYAGRSERRETPLHNGRVFVEETGDTPGSATAFRYGIVVSGVGAILFALSGKSSSERNGYNF
jgi:hypothetical protein